MFYRGKVIDGGDGREMGAKRQRVVDQGPSFYGTSPASSFMYNPAPYTAYVNQPPPFPVVRVRGLPFDCTETDVAEFFHGLDIVDILFVHNNGKFSGEAFCVLGYPLQVDFALQRNRQNLGRRYIEVFRSKRQEYYKAIAREVSDARGGSPHRRAPRAKSYDEAKDSAEHTGVLRLRGLPFSAGKDDIMEFFKDFVLSEDAINITLTEMEITRGGTDENPTVYESEKDNQIGAGRSEVESNVSADATLQTEVGLMGTDERRGVLDDGPAASEFERHEQVETGGEGKCNVTVDVISPDDETQTVSQLKQQALGIHEEEKSIAESLDWENVGYQKNEKLSGDATHELAVESPPMLRESNEVPTWENKDNEEQPLVAIGEEKKVEEEAEHESQDEKVLIDQVIGFEIEQPLVAIGEEKKEAEEAENESQNNKVLIDQAIGSEIESEEVPLHVEKIEGKGEPLPLSPTASQVSVDECNVGVESDEKLIEENKKLREMMEKLIAAGKEQLTVISNLTVRVRGLEKQLAKKKKLRRKPALSRSSCVKPANKALKERAVGVAM